MKVPVRNEFIIPLIVLVGGFAWIAMVDTYRDMYFVAAVAIGVYLILRLQRRRHLQSEKEYQVLFDSSPVPMWIFNRATLQFLHVNRAAVKHYGYTEREFLAMTIMDIRPEAEQQKLAEYISNIKTEAGHSDMWRHRKKTGELIIVQVISNNVLFKGQVRRLAVANDITDLRKAEENSKRAGEKIRLQNQKLRGIAFHTSHIVRAPLANIMGLISLLKANGIGHPENDELLQLLVASAAALDKTLKDIMAETIAVEDDVPVPGDSLSAALL